MHGAKRRFEIDASFVAGIDVAPGWGARGAGPLFWLGPIMGIEQNG